MLLLVSFVPHAKDEFTIDPRDHAFVLAMEACRGNVEEAQALAIYNSQNSSVERDQLYWLEVAKALEVQ